MMRVVSFGLFICRMITVASPLQTVHAPEDAHGLDASQSRYHSSREYHPHDGNHPQDGNHPHDENYPHYDHGITANHFHHPLHYKAPPHFTDTKWPHQQPYNRRTFFPDYPLPYDHRGTTTPFPAFYQFITSLFGGAEDPHPDKYRYHPHRTTPPYPYQYPYSFAPTEPNYIPPPKPIRASVIKLESVTRSPLYSSFDADATTKYFHNVGTLLNHVLIENSKHRQEGPVDEVKIPPFKPLPTPRYPDRPRPPVHDHNKTDYKYPESVQDQLPHLQFGDAKIPYVSEKPIPQIFETLPTETSPKEQFGYTKSPDVEATTRDILSLIDIRGLNLSGERRPGERRGGLGVKSFPGAVEKIKRPTVGFTKKVSTHPDQASVERVNNLTVQGLSKTEEKVIPSNHVNYQNVRDVIDYHVGRLETTTGPPATEESPKRLVNLNDELSLDAKILKDTNWDGFGPSGSEEASTPVAETKKPGRKNPAFWEVVAADNTTLPFTESAPTTFTTERTERGTAETTTELWFVTKDSTETNEPSTTTEVTSTPKAGHRRSGSGAPSTTPTEESQTDRIILTERSQKRRYSRRPKVVNFTPYPTGEELQRKLANRTHFPKRQKPNITLAFGNKSVVKSGQSFGKDEVMKFSDEEVRKRRKVGKSRQLYERKRASSSERSVGED